MLTKPVLYLCISITASAIYVGLLIITLTTHSPVVPLHLNSAIIGLMATVVVISSVWCIHMRGEVLADRRAAAMKEHFDQVLVSLGNAVIEHTYRVTAHSDRVALTTDVARVQAAIEESDRDRDLQVARIYDAIGEVGLTADRELRAQMTWVIEQLNGEKP